MLVECMSISVLSPAHKCEMRGSLLIVRLLMVKYLSILFKFSYSVLDWKALSWIVERGGGEGFLEMFLEGSVDDIIYRNYSYCQSELIYFL